MEITADGFAPLTQKIDIAPGAEKKISLALLALPKAVDLPPDPPAAPPKEPPNPVAPAAPSNATTGLLMIKPVPNYAWVTVDGKSYGSGKSVRLELSGGDHVVTAGGNGLVSQQLPVRIEPGKTTQLPIQLARAPAALRPRPRPEPRAPVQERAYYPPPASASPKPVEPIPTYRPAPAPAPAPAATPAPAAPSAPHAATGLPPP